MDPLNISAKSDVCSFTHSWDNRGNFKNLGRPWSPWIRPRSLFSQIFKVLLFTWTLWIYPPSLKFVAIPVPEIIRGTQKIWALPVYAHAPFSPKILKGFYDFSTNRKCVCGFLIKWFLIFLKPRTTKEIVFKRPNPKLFVYPRPLS